MAVVQVAGRERKENTMAQKANSLAHTKWMCAFSQVKVDSLLCRFPTLRSGHARAPSFRYQRA